MTTAIFRRKGFRRCLEYISRQNVQISSKYQVFLAGGESLANCVLPIPTYIQNKSCPLAQGLANLIRFSAVIGRLPPCVNKQPTLAQERNTGGTNNISRTLGVYLCELTTQSHSLHDHLTFTCSQWKAWNYLFTEHEGFQLKINSRKTTTQMTNTLPVSSERLFLCLFHRGLTEHGTDQQQRRKHNPKRRC